MPGMDFDVRGADEFARLSKALKSAGRTELRKQLNKKLRDATKPLIAETRQAAGDLPSRGGFAALVAKEPQRVQVRTGDKTAGVRIVVGKKSGGARAADQGSIRHPVFGRPVFVTQSVKPGWFTETLRDSAPTVRPFLEQALEDVARQVVNEARS